MKLKDHECKCGNEEVKVLEKKGGKKKGEPVLYKVECKKCKEIFEVYIGGWHM